MKRIHIHVRVESLENSVGFYSALFGAEPTRHEADYAKWMLDDPRINFAISDGHGEQGIEHLGIQADSDEELGEIRERLVAANASTLDQENTTCCYATGNKTWTRDPQDVVWETFHTMAEAQHYGESPDLEQTTTRPVEAGRCC